MWPKTHCLGGRETRDRADDTFGCPQGLTTVYWVVPSGVMPGFRERHLFTNSMSQHIGTGATGTAGVPLYLFFTNSGALITI